MLKGVYKRWLLLFSLMLASLHGVAQQYHFIYIQADNQQPFYVKYNSKNYSSSSIGYLILPKLNDGTILLQIGFPKNLYPEENFNVSIAGKDLGFALKNFNEKGWGLFNFQTTDIVMNGNQAAASNDNAAKTINNTSNAFGNMLASAINDSTLNQQRAITIDSSAKTTIPATPNMIKDTVKTTADNKAIKDNTSAALQTSLPSYQTPSVVDSLIKKYSANSDSIAANKKMTDSSNQIIKSSEKTTNNGTDLTFLDNTSKDTIHAFIPSSNGEITEAKAAATDSAKGKVNNPFFNNNNNTTTSTSQPAVLNTATANNVSPESHSQVNTSCNKMFSNSDADKLKKKIISFTSQDDILNAVHKSLRDKCISTDQVKDLGNLFLSDENRYGFYDAVYPFVYDYGNYAQLQNTLIDTYYKNRFKALLR